MESIAVKLHKNGMNCGKSIFKGICEKQHKEVAKETLDVFGAINSGFGVGVFCSALIGTIGALSLFFDEEDMQKIRLELLMDFNEKYGSFDCCKIGTDEERCYEILEYLENWASQKIWDKKDLLPVEY